MKHPTMGYPMNPPLSPAQRAKVRARVEFDGALAEVIEIYIKPKMSRFDRMSRKARERAREYYHD